MLHFLQILYVHPSKKNIIKIILIGLILIGCYKAVYAAHSSAAMATNSGSRFDQRYAAWKAMQLQHDQRLQAKAQRIDQSKATQTSESPTTEPIQSSNESMEMHPTVQVSSATIQLNNANLEQLQQLKGVGAKKAQAILDYRLQNGPFKQIDELKNVKGIGESTLEKNRSQLRL